MHCPSRHGWTSLPTPGKTLHSPRHSLARNMSCRIFPFLSQSAGSSRSDHGSRRLNGHHSGGIEGASAYGTRAQAVSPKLAPIVDAWAKGETSDGAITATDPPMRQSTRNTGDLIGFYQSGLTCVTTLYMDVHLDRVPSARAWWGPRTRPYRTWRKTIECGKLESIAKQRSAMRVKAGKVVGKLRR